MTEGRKTCRMCGEDIKSVAKRCPHCTHYQSRLNAPVIILILAVATMIGMRFALPSPLNRETLYDASDRLVIVETTPKYAKDDCGAFITILGKLKNQTTKTWSDVHFEVKFYNEKNELVDTLTPAVYPLVIAPHGEAAFRLRERAAAAEGQYQRHEIKITKAQEDFRF